MTTELLLLGLAGKAFWECTKKLLKDKGVGYIEKTGRAVQARVLEGALPPNHDLDHALRRSLAKAARVLAYTLHRPQSQPLSDLITEMRVASIAERLAEIVQGNIEAAVKSDYWLMELIHETKRADAFLDVSLEMVEADARVVTLLDDSFDDTMRDHIHREFLAWTDRHVTINPHEPANFRSMVLMGWKAPGEVGRIVTLYELFCLFFREELKQNERVFRVFAGEAIASLKVGIDGMRATSPTVEERDELHRAISALQDFAVFAASLETTSAMVVAGLARIEAEVMQLAGGQLQLLKRMDGALAIQRDLHGLVEHTRARQQDGLADAVPDEVRDVLEEGEALLDEGRYNDSYFRYVEALQAAEAAGSDSARVAARIGIAAALLHSGTRLAEARETLREALSAMSRVAQNERRCTVIQLLGDVELVGGNAVEAHVLYRQARILAEREGDRFRTGTALLSLSQTARLLGDVHEARSLIELSMDLFHAERTEGVGAVRTKAAVNLACCMWNKALILHRDGLFSEAVVWLAKAEALFRDTNSRDNVGRALLQKAEALLDDALWQDGLDALHEALTVFEETNDIEWQCQCLDRIAKHHYEEGDSGEALRCLGREVALRRSQGLEAMVVSCLLRTAEVRRRSGESAQAAALIHAALESAVSLQDTRLVADCRISQAALCEGADDATERSAFLEQALDCLHAELRRREDRGQRARVMQRISWVLGQLQKTRDARRWCDQALQEFETLGDAEGINECLWELSRIERADGALDGEEVALTRLLEAIQGQSRHDLRAAALHHLGNVKLAKGELVGAECCLRDAAELAVRYRVRGVREASQVSLRRLTDAQELRLPPSTDLSTLVGQLHEWCEQYPAARRAILPLWYFLHRRDLWRVCRSLLGVKFIVRARDAAAFGHADVLSDHADLLAWGATFVVKCQSKGEVIPCPRDLSIPRGTKILLVSGKSSDDRVTHELMRKGLKEAGEAYVGIPVSGPSGSVADGSFIFLGAHRRFPSVIGKIMLASTSSALRAGKRICLPLGEGEDLPSLLTMVRVGREFGMIPVVLGQLPPEDGVHAVCDCTLDLPVHLGDGAADGAVVHEVRRVWQALLMCGKERPADALMEFSRRMLALGARFGVDGTVRVRVFLVGLPPGADETWHPVVLLPSAEGRKVGARDSRADASRPTPGSLSARRRSR